ncbi:MAG TPA: chromate resistance protein ChrB domain-containing protein [Pseudomonadales bacterium]|jgi:hypothetical protein|nr:chromate resistance protein ChrB domain-containing protein [Pseudomonadales bacterium]
MKEDLQSNWTLLILTIPGRQTALRVRMWRKLKVLGAGTLQDGVYVVPARTELRSVLEDQTADIRVAGGTAQLFDVTGRAADFAPLFDRTAEYEALTDRIRKATPGKRHTVARAARAVNTLRREFEAIAARDFFPGPALDQTRQALDALGARVERLRSPDEPRPKHGRIKRRHPAEYQNRTWVTRAGPWVDRLASAWLIRRFIDAGATFKWSKRVARGAGRGTGFDFDGAAFTHVDGKVTYEVLVESFGLEDDAAIVRIGAIVHFVDVGGISVAEAPVIEALLHGMKRRTRSDAAFFALAATLFDDLYAGYQVEESRR